MSTAQFAVTLSFPPVVPVTARWATKNGTAFAGVDYVAATGTLRFEPGEVAKTVDVELIETQATEARFFSIELLEVGNATPAPATGGGGAATIVPTFTVRGPPGRDGRDGTNGRDGADGADGLDGKDGKDGADGKDGENGDPGLSAYQVWLAAGNTGSVDDYLASLKGADGADGTGLVNRGAWVSGSTYNPSEYVFAQGTTADSSMFIASAGDPFISVTPPRNDLGNWVEFSAPAGPKGERGEDGADGKDGANGTNGTNGADGKTVLNGTTVPAAGLGTIGDFYLRTGAAPSIYGPKTAGGWGSATSLVGTAGAAGSKWYVAAGVPAAGTGVAGDYALNSITGDIYGPKATNWGSAVGNLKGPKGDAGSGGGGGDSAVTRVIAPTNVVIQSLEPVTIVQAALEPSTAYLVRFAASLNDNANTKGITFCVGGIDKREMVLRVGYRNAAGVLEFKPITEGGKLGGATFAGSLNNGPGNLVTIEGFILTGTTAVNSLVIQAFNADAQYDYRQFFQGAALSVEKMGTVTLS